MTRYSWQNLTILTNRTLVAGGIFELLLIKILSFVVFKCEFFSRISDALSRYGRHKSLSNLNRSLGFWACLVAGLVVTECLFTVKLTSVMTTLVNNQWNTAHCVSSSLFLKMWLNADITDVGFTVHVYIVVMACMLWLV